MKKNRLAVLAVVGSMFSSLALAKKEVSTLSLEELKAKCHEKELDEQVMKFHSTFVCSEERTFWVVKGEKRFVLENQSTVRIKALIKDDRHQTDWWEVPSSSEKQAAVCPVMEQWRVVARDTVTLKSCDQLDQITSEDAFCQARLEAKWAECDAERVSGTTQQGFSLPKAPLCEYDATGLVKSCSEEGPTTPPVVQDQCQQDGGDKCCGQQDGSSSSSSSDECAPLRHESQFDVGASLREISVKRSFWHRNHRVVLVDSPVSENSLLGQLNLKQGDMVSRVNDQRTKDLRTFLRLVKEAKNRGVKVKLEYRGSETDQKFVEKLVSF